MILRSRHHLRIVLAAALGAAGLCAAPAAQAATFCVAKPACSGISFPTLKAALDASVLPANPGADRVEVGEGEFPGPVIVPKGGGAEIIGSGRGKTVIVGQPATWVLIAGDENTHVSDLTIRMADGNSSGIDASEPGFLAERIDVQGPPNAASTSGIILRRGGTIRDASIQLDPAASPVNYGISLAPSTNAAQTDVSIEKVRITAGYGIYDSQWPAPVSVREAVITAGIYGVGISTPSPQVRLESIAARIVHTSQGDAGAGVGISTSLNAKPGETTVTARHLTLVSLARGGSGLRIRNEAGQPTVRFTGREIVTLGGADWFPTTFGPPPTGSGDPVINEAITPSRDIRVEGAGTVDVHLSESAWHAGSVGLLNPNSRLADDGGNVDLEHHPAPLADAAAGNLLPAAGSVLVDNGTADSGLDAIGNPRPVDGDGNGLGRADIGALEAAPGTNPAPVAPYLQEGSCDSGCKAKREADRLASLPVSKLGKLAKKKVRSVSGTAKAATQVRVSITRIKGKRCEALSATQRWVRIAKPIKKHCTPSFALAAKGSAKWTLKLSRALPAGTYEIASQGMGAAGAESKPVRKTFRLR